MNVLQALAVTRNMEADFNSFVEAVLVLYINLSRDKVVYHCHQTGQCVHFELTDVEREYICWEMLSEGKDPYEEGLLER